MTGNLRRRTLLLPAAAVRPTREMVRKAMFDVLSGACEGAAVLDLFSGSGALGFEALSGGCSGVTFVERQSVCCRIIRENAQRLGVEARCRILKRDVFSALPDLSRVQRFAVVIADPPYTPAEAKKCLLMLGACDIVLPAGLVVIEHHKSAVLPLRSHSLLLWKTKCYGDTRVSFYRCESAAERQPQTEG
jgi:16S rRNA (guanine(966)-N(2))-methyltransferase RsmD